MARKRSINPSFWSNDKLTCYPRDVRLLYIGLFSNADDKGRLPGSARRIRGIVFPHDEGLTDTQVEDWLQLLTKGKRINRWEENGEIYIEFPPSTWDTEQKMNYRAVSKLPSYNGQPLRFTQDLRRSDAGLIHVEECSVVERRGEESSTNLSSADADKAGSNSEDFEQIWKILEPLRPYQSKKAAKTQYKRRLKEGVAHTDLVIASTNYARAMRDKEPEFIKHAERFLGPKEYWRAFLKLEPERSANGWARPSKPEEFKGGDRTNEL